jgi:DNA-binding transcriptional regulator YiaG
MTGEKIKGIRKRMGMTQTAFAGMLGTDQRVIARG